MTNNSASSFCSLICCFFKLLFLNNLYFTIKAMIDLQCLRSRYYNVLSSIAEMVICLRIIVMKGEQYTIT